MERRGFAVGGTWCVDRNITVDRWPGEDMLATVHGMSLSGGGPVSNFGQDIRRLDPSMPVTAMGLLGQDEQADYLIELFGRAGIECREARTAEAPTQITDAFHSASSGRRTHIAFLGTAPLLTPDHFDFAGVASRMFHIGLPGLHAIMDRPWGGEANGWVAALKKARAAGLETSLELVSAPAATIRDLGLPCLPHLTVLVVNDHEIGALAGRPTLRDGVTDEAQCLEAARDVLAMGAMELVAVHFTMGAVLVARDGTVARHPSVAMPESEMRGPNGCGDAFAAGFLLARHEGRGHVECLRLGHAAAAACLRAPDPSSAVVSAAQCLALAERWGWRD